MAFSEIAVIIPTLDEEEGIKLTLREMKEVLSDSRFIVVDGGSKDRTVEIAKDIGAEIFIQDGKGKGDAIRKGLSELDNSTKYVVFNDADYTYSTSNLVFMISVLNKNPEVGMVLGDRFNNKMDLTFFVNPFFLSAK